MPRANRFTRRHHGRARIDPALIPAVDDGDRPVRIGRSSTTGLHILRTAVATPGVGATILVLWFCGPPVVVVTACLLVLMWILGDDARTNRARALIYREDGPVRCRCEPSDRHRPRFPAPGRGWRR